LIQQAKGLCAMKFTKSDFQVNVLLKKFIKFGVIKFQKSEIDHLSEKKLVNGKPSSSKIFLTEGIA